MNSIIWRGVSSTTIKGLIISELPPISKPEMRVSETLVDGRNGSVIEDLGYNAYDKAVVIGLYGAYDINEVIKYFSGEGDVVFSNEPDKVYRAKIYAQIDYNRLLRYRQATVLFRTQPFKYAFNEEIIATETATALGTSIVVNDSENANLKEFKIYGKSTQDGIPTPDAPIDIVSLGDDGEISADIYTGNLFDVDNFTHTGSKTNKLENGWFEVTNITTTTAYPSIVFKGVQATGKFTVTLETETNCEAYFKTSENDYTYQIIKSSSHTKDFTGYCAFMIVLKPNTTLKCRVTINKGENALPYEPYNKQSVAFSTPLRAIPVTDESLATYTDAEGKMWCADEIDLERGVYIQRIQEVNGFSLNKTTDVCDVYQTRISVDTLGTDLFQYALCTHTDVYKYNSLDNTHFYVHGEDIWVYVPKGTNTEGLTVYALLETPIETPLTEEQIAICKTLKANNLTTTIFNDENAYMSVEYLKPFEVENKGLETSRPTMTITGNGTVEIFVNGVGIFTYTFPEGENQVVIDSEKEDAYLGSVLKNRNMNGEFPILQPGTNKIEWTGDVESIEIEPKSRWL